MATHVAAFLITVFAYRYARNHINNPKYIFGTGKVNVLGGFTSAMALVVIAFVMVIESCLRLVQPQVIQFDEAIYVAILGLVVNLVSAFLLQGSTTMAIVTMTTPVPMAIIFRLPTSMF